MPAAPLHDRRYRPDDVEPTLAEATDRLYAAFASRPVPAGTTFCPHCVTVRDLDGLNRPARTIEPALLSRFVRKAGTTWGGPHDLARVTPRALELAAAAQLGVSRGLLWAKLRAAGWPDWPAAERDAVHDFLLAEWVRLLRSPARPAHAAHRWLAHTAEGIDDLGPFLATWDDAMGSLPHPPHQEAAIAHLVDLLTTSPLRPDLPATMGSVFPGNPHAAAQATAWLTGAGPAHELQRAAVARAHTASARRLNVAVERLRRFRAAAGSAAEGASA